MAIYGKTKRTELWMFYLLLKHRQTIKQGIDYIPKTFQNHVDMIWVSPNTGYPMSLGFISVSIKLVLIDKEATMIQDHLDVHSKLLALRRWIFSESGLSGLAYCCILIIWQLFSNMLEYWWFGTCFFHSVGNVVTPTVTHSIIFQRARAKNHQPDI